MNCLLTQVIFNIANLKINIEFLEMVINIIFILMPIRQNLNNKKGLFTAFFATKQNNPGLTHFQFLLTLISNSFQLINKPFSPKKQLLKPPSNWKKTFFNPFNWRKNHVTINVQLNHKSRSIQFSINQKTLFQSLFNLIKNHVSTPFQLGKKPRSNLFSVLKKPVPILVPLRKKPCSN